MSGVHLFHGALSLHAFHSAAAIYALRLVVFVWVVAEISARYLAGRHKAETAKRGDRGSRWIIFLGYLASIGLALGVRAAGVGLLPAWIEWLGLFIMLLGIALRTWAIFLLGRFFSVRVELQVGHHVVSVGPYRYIRHPAYTGLMIALPASVWFWAPGQRLCYWR